MEVNVGGLLAYLVLWAIILYVLWWALGKIAPPEPFDKLGVVALVILTVCVLLAPLFGYVHVPHLVLR